MRVDLDSATKMSPPSGLPRRERRLTATNDALNLHHSFHVRRLAADVERMDRARTCSAVAASLAPAGASPTEASRDDTAVNAKYEPHVPLPRLVRRSDRQSLLIREFTHF